VKQTVKKTIMTNLRYKRVSRKRNCLICGKPDWCSFTPDETISFCARITCGADRVSKTGWGVYYHDSFTTRIVKQRRIPSRISSSILAPVALRDFTYRNLIGLAPATCSTEIIGGAKGLAHRKIRNYESYGSLPQTRAARNDLAGQIAALVRDRFPRFAEKRKHAMEGIPGFWIGKCSKPQIWLDNDYACPMMLVPFRDANGFIQACQIRFMGRSSKNYRRYVWLSTPELTGGTSCGTPLHFAGYNSASTKPLLVTEGALKADTARLFAHGADVVGSAGVACSHEPVISAARFRIMLLGFDADKTDNHHVARAVANLLCLRLLDQEKYRYDRGVRILMWASAVNGIDDAFLQNVPISQIAPLEWFDALNKRCRLEVERYFKQYGGQNSVRDFRRLE
jgi:hypothetical protein